MITLGINAAFHDSSAAVVVDGVLIAAAEEERFTRIKHAKRPVPFSAWELPFHAIDYCLREAGVDLRSVDHISYAFDPQLLGGVPKPSITPSPSSAAAAFGEGSKWDALFHAYILDAPAQLASGAPHHLSTRFWGAQPGGPHRWHYVPHHLAHEASAFLAAPFDAASVLTLDGRGERATTTFGHFDGREYRRLRAIEVPHSLGLLYEDITRHLGFLHSSDEYKVMALASYGEPRYTDAFREIVRVDDRGGLVVDTSFLPRRFGAPRRRGEQLSSEHFDLARSLQARLEEVALELVAHLVRATGERRLVMAGGVALNCVMNSRIRDSGLADAVWVQPAAGDAGTALGAALWTDWSERGRPPRTWRMDHAYYGPRFADEEIEALLRSSKVRYRELDDVGRDTARLLAEDKIIGWFQGRMEFGPRALGARSILASPIDPAMQARLNELKDREDFRPVAPVVPEEHLADWFEPAAANGGQARFMLFVYDVKPDAAARIPAVRHVDGTARVQTVCREQNPRYHDTLMAFGALTGVPVLVNTSFNTRGEPIVCTPRDALESFWTTPLDALVIGRFVVEK